ncbi:MAG: maleylpyruvate isomerase N-terminal domain-containing protein [Pseudonocardiaceae bacterium]
MSASSVDWQHCQDALRDEVGRVTALLRSIRDPGAAAVVGHWNLAEVALHLSQVWLGIPGLARGDRSGFDELVPDRAGVAGEAPVRDVADLGAVTTRMVRADPERDLGVLADRIEARAQQYFAECAGRSPDEPRPWLIRGVTLPLSAFTGHLLNETVVHGYDIARAAGRPGRINPTHAVLVMDRFFLPLLLGADTRKLVNPDTVAGVRATFDVRIRGGSRFHLHFVFHDSALRVQTPSARRIDCHLSAAPVAFLLVFWNRHSQWQAIATGQLMAWGRKPWLAPRFRGFLTTP